MREIKLIILLLAILLVGCNTSSSKKHELIVFHAGSLSIPMKRIEAEYEKLHPEIDIVREASGSRKAARKISDLNRNCDLFISADYRVIENLLLPTFADHVITFAGNEMVIAYNEESRLQEAITTENWFQIIQNNIVGFGRTDPELDPCGYRTILVFQLASEYYQKPNLTELLSQKDIKYIRGTEAELSALLESGELDYLFLYKSVAIQHGLKYIQLPDSINLSNPDLNTYYEKASIELGGKTKGGVIVHKGGAITYGLCIPKNALNKELALDFTSFILSKEKGMKIIEEQGQNPLPISVSAIEKSIQDSLKQRLF